VKVVIASLALAGALLVGAYLWLFARPERKAEEAAPPAPETLVVATASGTVEVAGPDGAWQRVTSGRKLLPNDRVRTGEDGVAELRAADGSVVKLLEATDARVDALRRELKRLHLAAGAVEAEVRDDPTRLFEVELDEKGGVARTRGAKFTATSDGKGAAVVGAHRGEVILSARGKEVVIRSGQFARLAPGAGPETPAPLPPSLFLKVAWPPAISPKSTVVISGTTSPGARVKVGGKWLLPDRDGAYRSTVVLKDGPHELSVSARDLTGRTTDEKSPRIVVDTRTDFKIQRPNWK
jgi:hypothetical protein